MQTHQPDSNPKSISDKILDEACRQGDESAGELPGESIKARIHGISFVHTEKIARSVDRKLAERSFFDRLMGRIRRKQHRINALFVDYFSEIVRKQRAMYDALLATHQQFKALTVGTDQLAQRLKAAEDHMATLEARLLRQSRMTGTGESGASADFDSFYVAFENVFRGPEAVIKERQRVYLPYVERSAAATGGAPVLDIGCGRGEWLELMREAGHDATGLDSNGRMAAHCAGRGLNVITGDALAHVSSLPENSLGVVTGFHIVEHLPFPKLIALVDACLKALKPGGALILETPNPENLVVGSNYFYHDPTHLHPLPSLLMKFLVEHAGFAEANIIPLHPRRPDVDATADNEALREINHFVNGPMDYGLVAWKQELAG